MSEFGNKFCFAVCLLWQVICGDTDNGDIFSLIITQKPAYPFSVSPQKTREVLRINMITSWFNPFIFTLWRT